MEVKELTDQLERDMHREFKTLREERDTRMTEIAQREITAAKESIVKFIGWGGVVGAMAVVYFFGGLTRDVEALQLQAAQIVQAVDGVEQFMNRGDRFTIDDGNELKSYVDQQDEYVLRRVDDGFKSLGEQISRLETINK